MMTQSNVNVRLERSEMRPETAGQWFADLLWDIFGGKEKTLRFDGCLQRWRFQGTEEEK